MPCLHGTPGHSLAGPHLGPHDLRVATGQGPDQVPVGRVIEHDEDDGFGRDHGRD
jgi:hypothetical protein